MRIKTTLVLLGLLGLLGALWAFAGKDAPPGPEEGKAPSPWADGFDPRKADFLKFIDMDRGNYMEVRFRRDRELGEWRMVFPTRDRADRAQVEEVLRILAENPWSLVGGWDSLDGGARKQMGLADQEGNPSGRGLLEMKAGKERREVWIGETTVDGTKVYVLTGGKVWVTPLNLWTAFDHNPPDFRDHKVFTIPLFKVRRVLIRRNFTKDGRAGVEMSLFQSDRGLWMLKEGNMVSRADPRTARNFLALLAGLRVASFVGDLPGDLSRVGLAPPFYQVVLEGGRKTETLSVGKLGGGKEGVLCVVSGRPFLLAVDLGNSFFSYVEGRGVKTPGTGVDFRGLRPVPVSPVSITWVEALSREGKGFRLERETQGRFDLVKPWKRAARDNRVLAWLKELTGLKASSTYPAAEMDPVATGLAAPEWTVEIGREGFTEPFRLLVGRRKGRGVYLGVPGENVVYFAPAEAVKKIHPSPLELVSLVVFRIRLGRAGIVVLEAEGKMRRWDLDTQTGEYRDEKGRSAGDSFLDMMDTLTDLSGIEAVSDRSGRVEKDENALVFRFHAFPMDPASKEPGRLLGSLYLLKKGSVLLAASSQSEPLVFRVPGRVWDAVTKGVPALGGK